MRYNRLGSTGLFVSELCLGTMTFGGRGVFGAIGQVQQAEADTIVARALEAGVNFLDTADTYGEGSSERITGQALRNLGVKRDEIVVATKAFGGMGPGPNQRGSSRAHILDGVRQSLERLQLDHIDLYQLHGFDPATPIEESLEALTDLVRQGLVRYIGVSNWAAWQVTKALGLAAQHHLAKIASVQAYYSLAGRDVEREIVPMLQSEGPGLLAWSPLAGGLLGGKYTRTQSTVEGSRRSSLDFPPVARERGHAILDVLAAIAARHEVTVPRLAIAWLLGRPGVTSVLLGAKRVEQLDDTLRAVDVTLADEDRAQLDEVSRLPAEYPGWMFDIWSQERAKQLAEQRRK
ncbi:MAG: aldo/keto reductase [Myxococcales bacterium]|nr:MAG: aldo/keto reductase [Myxococcales bacterium]